MLLPHSPWFQLIPELCPLGFLSSSDSGWKGAGLGNSALLAWAGMSWQSELECCRESGEEEQGWLPKEARQKPAPEIQCHIEGKP